MLRLAIATLAAAAIVLITVPGPVNAQADAHGKDLFDRRCGGCHALDRDKEGPRLRGVYGRKSGSVPSFQYSAALKNASVTWDAASLDKWLADPEKLAPDNDMGFHLENAAERRDVIAYLKELSGK
jgi:cytochrome c